MYLFIFLLGFGRHTFACVHFLYFACGIFRCILCIGGLVMGGRLSFLSASE